jgi:hypothetical protein
MTAACAAVIVLAAPACAQFYEVDPADIPGKPGTVIRIVAFGSSPAGAQAYRVLYRQVGLQGDRLWFRWSSTIGEPPATRRNVIAWAHPTSGVAAARPHVALMFDGSG